jgi:hypothetical protein
MPWVGIPLRKLLPFAEVQPVTVTTVTGALGALLDGGIALLNVKVCGWFSLPRA